MVRRREEEEEEEAEEEDDGVVAAAAVAAAPSGTPSFLTPPPRTGRRALSQYQGDIGGMGSFLSWLACSKIRGGRELGEATVEKTAQKLRRERGHPPNHPPTHACIGFHEFHCSLTSSHTVFAAYVDHIHPGQPPSLADVANTHLFCRFLEYMEVRIHVHLSMCIPAECTCAYSMQNYGGEGMLCIG